ncbi:MAG: hypothetical protein K6F52_05280 [Clostridia bacterium]|nr:hypothetical protein [Clostridia bacterium]
MQTTKEYAGKYGSKMQKFADEQLAFVIRQVMMPGLVPAARINPHVYINTRAKCRFGACRRDYKTGSFIIELAEAMLTAPLKSIRQTLIHEVLHTIEGCHSHGGRWQRCADIVNREFGYNVKRASTPEENGITDPAFIEYHRKREFLNSAKAASESKYLVVCTKCGAEFPRMKMCRIIESPHMYRCRCGGKLKRIR